MWRPFASSFVEHSLDSFIVRHEKLKSTTMYTPVYRKSPRADISTNPFQLSQEDMDKRQNLFKQLRKKVLLQREQIKKNDIEYQHKVEVQLRYKRKTMDMQNTKDSDVCRIRSISSKNKSDAEESEVEPNSSAISKEKNSSGKVIFSEQVKNQTLPPIRRKSIE